MPPKKIVFLGSKPVGYQCLSFLLENAADAGAEVIAIATQTRREFDPAQDLAALAKAHNIPILQSMAALPDCDIVYSVQHHELLLQPHIDKARQIAVNLHMAPLPEYRGCNQFSFAIIDGKAEFGAPRSTHGCAH